MSNYGGGLLLRDYLLAVMFWMVVGMMFTFILQWCGELLRVIFG